MKHKFQKAKCWFLMVLTAFSISFSTVNTSSTINRGSGVGICSDENKEVNLPTEPTPPECH